MTRPVLALLAALLAAPAAVGQPAFKWGGDRSGGGAPFVYEDDGKLVGFEVELAEYLAARLGRKSEFVQNKWDEIRDALKADKMTLDVAFNGFEFRPDWEKETPSTIPYFVYTLRLIAPKSNAELTEWAGLRKPKPGGGKYRVGVLRGSFAHRYVEENYGDDVEVKPSDEVSDALKEVSLEGKGQLDASVQDSPAAVYYVQQGRMPNLRVVGKPEAKNYYVILTRPGGDADPADRQLREALNDGIRQALKDGTLEAICRKYGLWDSHQEQLEAVHAAPWPPPDAQPSSRVTLGGIAGKLLRATWTTVWLAFAAMPLAILLGVFVAVGRVYGPAPLRWILTAYVEVLRGTPLLLQVFAWFYVLRPALGATGWGPLVELVGAWPELWGILALAVNYSASEAENYRAGLLAVPRGQTEAGLALGLSRRQTIRLVVLPQAARVVIPPVTNDFIALFKDTSIVSMILIVELTGLYYQYKSYPHLVVELTLVVALIYLCISYPLSVVSRRLERR